MNKQQLLELIAREAPKARKEIQEERRKERIKQLIAEELPKVRREIQEEREREIKDEKRMDFNYTMEQAAEASLRNRTHRRREV